MTWHTPVGERTLGGAEGELIRDLFAIMVDRISDNVGSSDDPIWEFGVDLFDELTPSQQLSVVNHVATHLLTDTKAMLDLSAVNEAAVYAVFQMLAGEIAIEIDTEGESLPAGHGPEWKFYWRSRALQAYRECFADEEDGDEFEDDDLEVAWLPPRDERNRNLPRWQQLAEDLSDRILWDRDFEMASDFLDSDPMKAGMMKQFLGIEDGYFSEVATDVGPGQVDKLLESVRRLTHRKPR